MGVMIFSRCKILYVYMTAQPQGIDVFTFFRYTLSQLAPVVQWIGHRFAEPKI